MKRFITYFAALFALVACDMSLEPEKMVPETPATETVSINVQLAEPATRAVINDTGSGAASFSWQNGDQIGVVVEGNVTGIEKCSKNGNCGATKMVTTVQQNR